MLPRVVTQNNGSLDTMEIMEKRSIYKPEYKAKIVLKVLREEKTGNQIAAEHQISPHMVSKWKAEFLERAPMVFEKGAENAEKLKREHEEENSQVMSDVADRNKRYMEDVELAPGESTGGWMVYQRQINKSEVSMHYYSGFVNIAPDLVFKFAAP